MPKPVTLTVPQHNVVFFGGLRRATLPLGGVLHRRLPLLIDEIVSAAPTANADSVPPDNKMKRTPRRRQRRPAPQPPDTTLLSLL